MCETESTMLCSLSVQWKLEQDFSVSCTNHITAVCATFTSSGYWGLDILNVHVQALPTLSYLCLPHPPGTWLCRRCPWDWPAGGSDTQSPRGSWTTPPPSQLKHTVIGEISGTWCLILHLSTLLHELVLQWFPHWLIQYRNLGSGTKSSLAWRCSLHYYHY